MILVSIAFPSFRKLLTFLFIFFCLCAGSALADSLLFNVASTPYDRQMTRIKPYLRENGSSASNQLDLAVVNRWIGDLRAIPYGFSILWETPTEVERGPIADCKGKSVALFQKMQACGAKNLRLVIGRRSTSSRQTHAWLTWETASGIYVLDPTLNWVACRTENLGSRAYIPLYAYAGARKYRAATTKGLLAQR